MRLYRALLYCYPAAFRQEYGKQMQLMFSEQLRHSRGFERTIVWLRAALDALSVAPREHGHVILQDVRYAFRMMAVTPTFTAVAVLSLALGIGANTAIFNLWNSVLYASLPGVRNPEQLIMLTEPGAHGMWTGMMTRTADGDRWWLTYEEFQHIRDHATSFSGVMASQSNLDDWQIRFENGRPEDAHERLVSGEFFDFLGVRPILGRTFTADEDRAGAAPYAVLSYSFWERRFGGRSDVLGKTIIVHKTPLTILGVAARGFIGETNGQRPDMWIPIGMQPSLEPGEDWLHDKAPAKTMWLQVFARPKLGATYPQAEAEVNALFQSHLQSFYGYVASEEKRRESLDQHIRLQSGSRGASNVRYGFLSTSLTALLTAVGVLLLIACANLANLFLARGAVRKPEIALRLSLGANRARLIRQLITESAVLALIGGVMSIGVAFALHRIFVGMIARTDAFQTSFELNALVLGFTFAVTLSAAVLFGALPAWQVTRLDAGSGLNEESRSATASVGRMRWGRALVSLQLALSLPLLVGAGLLVRTLYNLQHLEFGFPVDHLLLVQVDMREAGYNGVRQHAAIAELTRAFQQIPGVRSTSPSMLGIMGGGNASWALNVEGYVRKNNRDGGSDFDAVGPGYFSTLGIPLVAGRDISESDQAGGRKVCVINEAFAKQYFEGRDPMGMHITVHEYKQPITFEIVGVAKNARTQSRNLRRDIGPRLYIPATQQPEAMDAPTFLIRTAGDDAPVLSAARQLIQRFEPELPILTTETLEKHLQPLTSQERSVAQIATVFGCVALTLAAIGLYGVLAYGVVRRRTEIAIRIALGARPTRVIAMILRETSGLVALGLLLGAGFAYAGSRLIATQLFGVAPQDAATLSFAAALLILVALTAAYVPARRASRLDPMAALRRE